MCARACRSFRVRVSDGALHEQRLRAAVARLKRRDQRGAHAGAVGGGARLEVQLQLDGLRVAACRAHRPHEWRLGGALQRRRVEKQRRLAPRVRRRPQREQQAAAGATQQRDALPRANLLDRRRCLRLAPRFVGAKCDWRGGAIDQAERRREDEFGRPAARRRVRRVPARAASKGYELPHLAQRAAARC